MPSIINTASPKKRSLSKRSRRLLGIVLALVVLGAVATGIYFYIQQQQAEDRRLYSEASSKLDVSEIKRIVDGDRAATYGKFVASGNNAKAANVYTDLVESTDEKNEKLKLLEEYRKVAGLYENHTHEIDAAKQYSEIMDTYDSFWAAASVAGKYGEEAVQKEYLLKAYEAEGIPEDKRDKLLADDIAFQAELWKGLD